MKQNLRYSSSKRIKERNHKKEKIGPQFVRVATGFLFALVCEYGAA